MIGAADHAAVEQLAQSYDVSRETRERLLVYVETLRHWQRTTNLVAPDTLGEIWTRHIQDSAQLIRLAPNAKVWVDLGSGAGLPGMIIALLLGGNSDAIVYLVESNMKKCAFLRDVKSRTGAAVEIVPHRIESPQVASRIPVTAVDVVTARALAPLPQLLTYAEALMSVGAVALFMKGREAEHEVADATRRWSFDLERHDSISSSDSTILEVRSLKSL